MNTKTIQKSPLDDPKNGFKIIKYHDLITILNQEFEIDIGLNDQETSILYLVHNDETYYFSCVHYDEFIKISKYLNIFDNINEIIDFLLKEKYNIILENDLLKICYSIKKPNNKNDEFSITLKKFNYDEKVIINNLKRKLENFENSIFKNIYKELWMKENDINFNKSQIDQKDIIEIIQKIRTLGNKSKNGKIIDLPLFWEKNRNFDISLNGRIILSKNWGFYNKTKDFFPRDQITRLTINILEQINPNLNIGIGPTNFNYNYKIANWENNFYLFSLPSNNTLSNGYWTRNELNLKINKNSIIELIYNPFAHILKLISDGKTLEIPYINPDINYAFIFGDGAGNKIEIC